MRQVRTAVKEGVDLVVMVWHWHEPHGWQQVIVPASGKLKPSLFPRREKEGMAWHGMGVTCHACNNMLNNFLEEASSRGCVKQQLFNTA